MSIRIFLFLMVFVIAGVPNARADFYVYADEDHGITASFPDSWKIINNQKPDDVFTVSASGAEDFAQCRVRAREEGRFKIYPKRFDDEIVRSEFDEEFWRKYLAEYDGVQLFGYQENTGLGRGHASIAEARFYVPGTGTPKLGMFSVSFYNNTAYIAECSSAEPAYKARRNSFQSFMKSIDFKKVPHELTGGEYEYYNSNKPSIRVRGPKDFGMTVY
jgi:hypothetical protein